MFPFTPSHVKQANLYLEEAAKLLAYRRDIVTQSTIDAVQQCISALKLSLQSKDKAAIEGAMRNLDDACRDLAPPLRNGSWRENVEVFVVAISIALGVRTYFVQPFTIPTGSMQPTLNGIITKPTNNPPPNIAQRAVEWFVLGRDYFQIIAKRSERIVDLQERHAFGIKLGLATYSVVVTDQGEYSAYVPLAALKADLRCSPGRKVEPGAIIACGECNTGDHVLVDKISYHFRRPAHADVFVFNTAGIPTRDNVFNPGGPSQFYIKRLVAQGGDQLRIDPPTLFRNGTPAPEDSIKRVMAGTLSAPSPLGYKGYSNGSEHTKFPILGNSSATFEVPDKCYFALGDNSYHSSDSRDWGPVPQQNVVGRGWLVYWPFTRHWGSVK